jgi:hypothetical protein
MPGDAQHVHHLVGFEPAPDDNGLALLEDLHQVVEQQLLEGKQVF